MATQFFPELSATTQDNHVRGTDQDDNIIVVGDVRAFEGHTSRIYTGYGNDTVIIGGSMISEETSDKRTENSIDAMGSLLVNITGDMVAQGGSNYIYSSGVPGEESVLSVGGTMRATAGGENFIALEHGHNIVNIGAVDATDGGINFIGTGHAESFQLTVNGNVTSSADGMNQLEPYFGDLTIKGDVLAYSGGNNRMASWNEEGDAFVNVHGNVVADNAHNELDLIGRTANLIIDGGLSLSNGGTTDINIVGGLNHLSIAQGIHLDQGNASIALYVDGDHGLNEVNLGGITGVNTSFLSLAANATSNIINIDGDFTFNGGEAEFMLGGQENAVAITGMLSSEDASLIIRSNAEQFSSLTIAGGMKASNGENRIYLDGYGTNEIHVSGGLQAESNGIISLGTDESQALHISIEGDIIADTTGTNELRSAYGNDFFSLNGSVSTRGLQISAGEGYDVLELNALTHTQFTNHYRDWLNDLQANDTINDMGLEAIRIDMGRVTQVGLNSLGWLDDIVTAHNTTYEEQLALELNVDRSGRNLSLDDFFSSTSSDIFSGLDMSGGASNSLTISGSFSDNGMDGDFLRILGDNQDSVVLSNDWALSQSGFVDATGLSYDVYTNATDELLIQSGISIV